jgi:hypothetical protein
MNLCPTHWNQLKQAIKARGLWDLVSADGAEAMAVMQHDLDGKPATKEKFDPLLAATFKIYENAIRAGGLYMMNQKEDGADYCAVCEAEAHNAPGWIDLAADGVAAFARELQTAVTDPPIPPSNLPPQGESA